MNEAEFLASIKCELHPTLDHNGKQIAKLEKLKFKPLDCDDMLALHEFVEKHGRDKAYLFMFVRALVNPDGSRVLSDEAAPTLEKGFLSGPIGDSIVVIRRISGQTLAGLEGLDDTKKKAETSSTNGKTSPSSSASPKRSERRSRNS